MTDERLQFYKCRCPDCGAWLTSLAPGSISLDRCRRCKRETFFAAKRDGSVMYRKRGTRGGWLDSVIPPELA